LALFVVLAPAAARADAVLLCLERVAHELAPEPILEPFPPWASWEGRRAAQSPGEPPSWPESEAERLLLVRRDPADALVRVEATVQVLRSQSWWLDQGWPIEAPPPRVELALEAARQLAQRPGLRPQIRARAALAEVELLGDDEDSLQALVADPHVGARARLRLGGVLLQRDADPLLILRATKVGGGGSVPAEDVAYFVSLIGTLYVRVGELESAVDAFKEVVVSIDRAAVDTVPRPEDRWLKRRAVISLQLLFVSEADPGAYVSGIPHLLEHPARRAVRYLTAVRMLDPIEEPTIESAVDSDQPLDGGAEPRDAATLAALEAELAELRTSESGAARVAPLLADFRAGRDDAGKSD